MLMIKIKMQYLKNKHYRDRKALISCPPLAHEGNAISFVHDKQ